MKIIRFTALWCADCIVMRPRWEEAFGKASEIEIQDYDFDDHEEEAKKFGITRVPQLLILDNDGNEQERLTGMQDMETLEALIKKYFNAK